MINPLPLIYIAGPFRGATPYEVRKNVEAARDIGLTVARLGGYPVIPHTMTADFDKQLTDQFWLDGTMEMLRRCDAILLGHRWSSSSGARAEREEAELRGIPVFYSNNLEWERQLGDWVLAWQANPHRSRVMRMTFTTVGARTEAAAGVHDSELTALADHLVPPAPRMSLADSPPTSAPASAAAASPPPPAPETREV